MGDRRVPPGRSTRSRDVLAAVAGGRVGANSGSVPCCPRAVMTHGSGSVGAASHSSNVLRSASGAGRERGASSLGRMARSWLHSLEELRRCLSVSTRQCTHLCLSEGRTASDSGGRSRHRRMVLDLRGRAWPLDLRFSERLGGWGPAGQLQERLAPVQACSLLTRTRFSFPPLPDPRAQQRRVQGRRNPRCQVQHHQR